MLIGENKMLLKELEKVLIGYDIKIQYKEFQPKYKIMEFELKVFEIKELPKKYQDAKVLRIYLNEKIPTIFIEME